MSYNYTEFTVFGTLSYLVSKNKIHAHTQYVIINIFDLENIAISVKK